MKVFILLLTQLFFNSIFSSSPECKLKLFCYKSCNSLKLINGIDNSNQTPINLIQISTDADASSNNEYESTFSCQPGDSISFQSHNEDISNDNKIGIICELEISHALDSDNNNINIKYDTTFHGNKFGCSSCESLSDSSFNIFEANHNLYGQQNLGVGDINFVFKIPYEYSIENGKTFNNIFNSHQFKFGDLFKSKLVDAETDGRIKVIITQLPLCTSHSSHYGKLFKGSDEIATTESDQISLEELIKFQPNDEDQYGLFNIKYKIISTDNDDNEYEIKFNVCNKYCHECSEYDSNALNDYKCTSCKSGETFYVEDSASIRRCYSLSEIQNNYNNYYLGEPPTGDTYKPCSSNCLKCIKQSTNCLSCNNTLNLFFAEGKGNECIDNTTLTNYFLPENSDTYLECDKSCNGCSNQKKNCKECAENYFKIDGQEHYCYLEEELYYSFEQKYFKDVDVYKPCDENCLTCWGSATNCTKCKEGFNLVINEQDFSKTCKQQSEFINNKYFLLNGEEYYHLCDENCKSCQFSKTNCTLCNDGYYLIEDINKCAQINDDVIGYYLYDNRLFKKCNYTCKACDSIDKCTECAPPYYLLELDGGKAKCITQQEKKNNIIIII